MGIEDRDFDSSEGIGTSSEAPSEKSERQKESAKRAQKELQKTQKDEQKAVGDNNTLFQILLRFIQNPLYEELIPTITTLLEHTYPSRYILVNISLFYPEAAEYILREFSRQKNIQKLLSLPREPSPTQFDDQKLHHSIREWVSEWVDFSREYLIRENVSVILSQKLLNLLSSEGSRIYAEDSMIRFFSFFLSLRNIYISKQIARTYSEFIIDEYKKSLARALQNADSSLKENMEIDTNNLFGLG